MNDQNDTNSTCIIPAKKLVLLDHTRTGPLATEFYEFLKTRSVGQPRIYKWCAKTLEAMSQGFYPQRGPISVLLVGPSRVGKTLTAEILAEFLFGYAQGFSRIDGQDISLEHNVARITGAPPGYVGHGAEPMITQQKLDYPAFRSMVNFALQQADEDIRKKYFEIQEERAAITEHMNELGDTKADERELKGAQKQLKELTEQIIKLGIPTYDRKKYRYASIFLVDEIEKAHPIAFPNLLLRALDEGQLPLESKHGSGGSKTLDFRRTIIIATSNLGEEDLKKFFRETSGRSPGYRFVSEAYTPRELDQATYRICRDAVDKFFSTPFINRFGDVIAARPLSKQNLFDILEIELNKLRRRFFDPADLGFPIMIYVEEQVKEYLVTAALENPEKGVSLFHQKLNGHILNAIPTLKSTGQICEGDIIHVSLAGKELLFWREDRTDTSGQIIVLE